MVYYTLYLSEIKVRICTDEKLTFLKGVCHLPNLILAMHNTHLLIVILL